MLSLCLALAVAAQPPKKDPFADYKGEWAIPTVADAAGFRQGGNVTIGDGTISWKSIPKFAEKEGKATLTAVGKPDEGTLELKLGDQVYKGRYRVVVNAQRKERTIDIILAPAGKDTPKPFEKDFNFGKLPADVTIYLQLYQFTK